jgi:hypothetical protein
MPKERSIPNNRLNDVKKGKLSAAFDKAGQVGADGFWRYTDLLRGEIKEAEMAEILSDELGFRVTEANLAGCRRDRNLYMGNGRQPKALKAEPVSDVDAALAGLQKQLTERIEVDHSLADRADRHEDRLNAISDALMALRKRLDVLERPAQGRLDLGGGLGGILRGVR